MTSEAMMELSSELEIVSSNFADTPAGIDTIGSRILGFENDIPEVPDTVFEYLPMNR